MVSRVLQKVSDDCSSTLCNPTGIYVLIMVLESGNKLKHRQSIFKKWARVYLVDLILRYGALKRHAQNWFAHDKCICRRHDFFLRTIAHEDM